jgi:uncharacterized LabA/DUF88 family protein
LDRQASPVGAFFLYIPKNFYMERVNFYVDGFNFYHGLKRLKQTDSDWQKFYWLDFVKFFQHFIGDNQVLQKVYYFTAPPLQIDKSNRQSNLLEANNLINGNRFEVIKGQFYEKLVTCKVCHSQYKIVEEKRTDVNIAVRMLGDCSINNVDTLVLVSADSDMIPPLQFIKENYPAKKIRVYFPPDLNSGALSALMRAENRNVIRLGKSKAKFQNSIMPDNVSANGFNFTIPAKWKI